MVRIVKRDGRVVPFNKEKISNAILLAMRSINQINEVAAKEIADEISKDSTEQKSVEEIQDMVESALVARDMYAVAKEYIIYRNERSKLREQNSKIFKNIIEKVDCKNIENSNANVNEHAFDGRKKEASDLLQKYLAINVNMSEEVANAQKSGAIYEHDLSEYNIGEHNCLFVDFNKVFGGFETRNGAVRSPGSFSTACQQYAVIFQCQSQVQFGGVGSCHIDTDLAPYVKKSFIKHFKKGVAWLETPRNYEDTTSEEFRPFADIELDDMDDTTPAVVHTETGDAEIPTEYIYIDNETLKKNHPAAYAYAMQMLQEEGKQACQALYHNLNTLESRAGGQVPFTSINLGRDTTTEGRLVTKWLMQASIDGIGKFHTTSIFPISIFQYKKGVNAKPGDPNYDLKRLALKSLSKRIYPNWVNGDWSQAHEDPNDPDTFAATMGCVIGESVIDWRFTEDNIFGKDTAAHRGPISQLFTELSQISQLRITRYTVWSEFIDVSGLEIYDGVAGWVTCHRVIRNRSNKWKAFSFSNGAYLITTDDHPFCIAASDKEAPVVCDMVRKLAKDVWSGMEVLGDVVDADGTVHVRRVKITNATELTKSEEYSYDVTTASDHFTVNGIYSFNCRTMIGYDRHGLGYSKVGRGNNVPITMILPKLGIECGIALGERKEPDLEMFYKKFDELLKVTEKALLERYAIMKSQSPLSGPFMYMNGTIKDADKCVDDVSNSLRHNSLAFGFIGVAETCQAMFGKNHANGDQKVYDFALDLVKRIYDFAQEASERNDLNFVCYATPAESLCRTALIKLRHDFGVLPGITDREYITNSFHVPVWEKVSIFDKLRLEAPFTKFATGGTITYIELDSTFMQNIDAVEEIIDYAFDVLDIPYLAINFPIDTCKECGYSGEFNDHCPQCGSANIEQLRRVTGYLTTDYSHFNPGKYAEVNDRVKHSAYTNFLI